MKNVFRRLKYYTGLLFLFAKFSLIEQMEYRLNFVAGITVECGYMLIKLMYVVLVWQAGVEINGYSPDEMVMFIGTYIMMTGLYMSVYPNFCAIPGMVRDGSLDMVMVKPVNLQFMLTLRKVNFSMPIPNVLCGLVLICYGWGRAGLSVSFWSVAGFAVFCLSGAFFTYCLFLIPEILSFWLISVNGIRQISDALWDFNNMPMNIYGKHAQWFGTFVIPIFVITNFPTLFVMGELSAGRIIWGLSVPALVFLIDRILWRQALKHYASAS